MDWLDKNVLLLFRMMTNISSICTGAAIPGRCKHGAKWSLSSTMIQPTISVEKSRPKEQVAYFESSQKFLSTTSSVAPSNAITSIRIQKLRQQQSSNHFISHLSIPFSLLSITFHHLMLTHPSHKSLLALSNLTKPLCKASTKRPGVETWEDVL